MKKKRKSKYNAKKTISYGITFDSKKEARRYRDLKLMEMAGEIENLILQPKYKLQDDFKYKGKTIKAIYYIADFRYYDVSEKETVIEDCKGVKTAVYRLKKKLFLHKYPDVNFIET